MSASHIYTYQYIKMVVQMRRKKNRMCASAWEYKCIYVREYIYVYVLISASPILFKIDWQSFTEVRTNVMPLENWNVIFWPSRKG